MTRVSRAPPIKHVDTLRWVTPRGRLGSKGVFCPLQHRRKSYIVVARDPIST